MTTEFTIFAKIVTREKKIPFEVAAETFYTKANMEHLEKVITSINQGTAKLVEHDIIEDDE